MIYVGIGSRSSPPNALKQMYIWGRVLAELNFTLRSGGAQGADTFFEKGCDSVLGNKQIFLPWRKYNNHPSPLHFIPPEAYEIAKDVYGYRWQYLKSSVRKLMARNILQILGKTLDEPSDFVICWTPDGIETSTNRSKFTGGTGQAIACADLYNIPIVNLKNDNSQERIQELIVEISNDN